MGKILGRCVFLILLCSLLLIHAGYGQLGKVNPALQGIRENISKIVLLGNQNKDIPLKHLADKSIGLVNFGLTSTFDSVAALYAPIYKIAKGRTFEIPHFNTIIIGVSDKEVGGKRFQLTLRGIGKRTTIIAYSGNLDSLKHLNSFTQPILITTAKNPIADNMLAQAIFGGVPISGKLEQSVASNFKKGSGYTTSAVRLKYSIPEEVGMNSIGLKDIDKIAQEAIGQQATPGIVVLVAKEGKVIFHKAYGKKTYTEKDAISVNNIFDLASVTKITSTTPMAMKLYEENKLNVYATLGKYVSSVRRTDKEHLLIRDLLTHQAGLVPFIPFYKDLKPSDWQTKQNPGFTTKVADNFFIRDNFFDTEMWPKMVKSPLKNVGSYSYSDLSMYFMQAVVESISKESIEYYVSKEFYQPLGLRTMGYNTWKIHPRKYFVPTENDTSFRKQIVCGFVHDQGAALAGGVSGHAGLFSDANDLAIFFQMLLNGGSYGGEKYLEPSTIDVFTSRQSKTSRRGFGFDRKELDASKKYPSEFVSPNTFGHTGFTGTCVWVDPLEHLIFIFLSNRTYPSVSMKLNSLNIRGRILDAVYRAMQN